MPNATDSKRPLLAPALWNADKKKLGSSISISREWKVPPRPRPGRKPKAKNEAATQGVSSHAGEHIESCGLCESKDGCLCSDISLTVQSHQKHSPLSAAPLDPLTAREEKPVPPALQQILGSAYSAPAIPLPRSRKSFQNEDHPRKLRRVDAGFTTTTPTSPLPYEKKIEIASNSDPLSDSKRSEQRVPPILPPDDKCGFCTEVTPCVCAEDTNESTVQIDSEESCPECSSDAYSMLFCLSLGAAKPLAAGAVSIPCNLAFKTLQKHSRFISSDLGKVVRHLECSDRQVGVQSINRVLQELQQGEIL